MQASHQCKGYKWLRALHVGMVNHIFIAGSYRPSAPQKRSLTRTAHRSRCGSRRVWRSSSPLELLLRQAALRVRQPRHLPVGAAGGRRGGYGTRSGRFWGTEERAWSVVYGCKRVKGGRTTFQRMFNALLPAGSLGTLKLRLNSEDMKTTGYILLLLLGHRGHNCSYPDTNSSEHTENTPK